tara:strand:+ start:157 stop:591 length:435 start_codon:yes stop_codon:yes gene_type:complete
MQAPSASNIGAKSILAIMMLCKAGILIPEYTTVNGDRTLTKITYDLYMAKKFLIENDMVITSIERGFKHMGMKLMGVVLGRVACTERPKVWQVSKRANNLYWKCLRQENAINADTQPTAQPTALTDTQRGWLWDLYDIWQMEQN